MGQNFHIFSIHASKKNLKTCFKSQCSMVAAAKTIYTQLQYSYPNKDLLWREDLLHKSATSDTEQLKLSFLSLLNWP